VASVRGFLAGSDGAGRRALPVGELLEPVALAALLVLLVNDWVLKRWDAMPALVSGKLSDLAGLMVAPLIATAAFDLALWAAARFGVPVDFSLGRGRLYGTTAAIGALFTAVKLSPAAAGWLEGTAEAAGLTWRITPDPTDLIALPALLIAALLGRREIARVPLGRLEVLERRAERTGAPLASAGLADVAACGGDPAAVHELASALDRYFGGGSPSPVNELLAGLRRGSSG
jgi:hypothetical protein